MTGAKVPVTGHEVTLAHLQIKSSGIYSTFKSRPNDNGHERKLILKIEKKEKTTSTAYNQTKHKPSHLCLVRMFTISFLSILTKWLRSSPMVKSLRPSAVLMCWNSATVGPEPLDPNCSVTCFLIPKSVASDFQLPIVLDSVSSFDDRMPINFGRPDIRSATFSSSR